MPREKNPATPHRRKRAPRKTVAADTGASTPTSPEFVDPEQRAALIAEAAFFRAEQRGFAPGHEVEDWLAAEVRGRCEADARGIRARDLRAPPNQSTSSQPAPRKEYLCAA